MRETTLMNFFTTMLQIALSFLTGVYVGTEYECRPYIEHLRDALSKLEKKPPLPPKEDTTAPAQSAASSSWFSWGSTAAQTESKKEK